jgi:hypothetical protein
VIAGLTKLPDFQPFRAYRKPLRWAASGAIIGFGKGGAA